jgi:TetR/AcrR family transcriptional repressor of lmrAB and yxaGH operons
MLRAGVELIAERGWSVELLEVISRAAAPRGSIYYHFPDGKAQLARESLAILAEDLEQMIDGAAQRSPDVAAFLTALVEVHREPLRESSYRRGGPLTGVVTGGQMQDKDLDDAVGRIAEVWLRAVARGLRAHGVTDAEGLAMQVVTLIEGCLAMARVQRSERCLQNLHISLSALLPDDVA